MRLHFERLIAHLHTWWTALLSGRPTSAPLVTEPDAAPVCDDGSRPAVLALLWVAPQPGGAEIIEATRTGADEPLWTSVCRPATERERNASLLDRFEALNVQAERDGVQLDLWLACRPVREQALRYATSFPYVTLRVEATDAHRVLRRQIEERFAARTPSPQPSAQPEKRPDADTPQLFVATDASAGLHGRGIGIACVSQTGRHAQEYVDVPVDPMLGELLAIDLALRTFPAERLHVLTDSQRALRALNDPTLPVARLPKGARHRLAQAVTSGRLHVQWVRGHNGHVLNETADRLAMAARRGVQLNQSEPARRAIAENIVGGLLQPAAA